MEWTIHVVGCCNALVSGDATLLEGLSSRHSEVLDSEPGVNQSGKQHEAAAFAHLQDFRSLSSSCAHDTLIMYYVEPVAPG